MPTGSSELREAVLAVVPAWAQSAVQPVYAIAAGGCGDGCTYDTRPVRTVFDPWVLTQSTQFVDAAVAYEYAHALGFSHLGAYASSNWADAPEPWAREFHALDAGFRGTDDREAFADCIARAWTAGFPWSPEQVRGECPMPLALWVSEQAQAEIAG
jgi:hypothetical protein